MEFGCGCYTIILVISGILSSLTFKDKAIGIGIFVLLLAVAVGYLKIRDKIANSVNEKMSEDARKKVNVAKRICIIIIVCILIVFIWQLFIATTYLGKGVLYLGEYILNEIREFFKHFY